MRCTPLGAAVAIVLALWIVWKFILWKWGDAMDSIDLEGLGLTPVDIMVFIAIGFVGLLLAIHRQPSHSTRGTRGNLSPVNPAERN